MCALYGKPSINLISNIPAIKEQQYALNKLNTLGTFQIRTLRLSRVQSTKLQYVLYLASYPSTQHFINTCYLQTRLWQINNGRSNLHYLRQEI